MTKGYPALKRFLKAMTIAMLVYTEDVRKLKHPRLRRNDTTQCFETTLFFDRSHIDWYRLHTNSNTPLTFSMFISTCNWQCIYPTMYLALKKHNIWTVFTYGSGLEMNFFVWKPAGDLWEKFGRQLILHITHVRTWFCLLLCMQEKSR